MGGLKDPTQAEFDDNDELGSHSLAVEDAIKGASAGEGRAVRQHRLLPS